MRRPAQAPSAQGTGTAARIPAGASRCAERDARRARRARRHRAERDPVPRGGGRRGQAVRGRGARSGVPEEPTGPRGAALGCGYLRSPARICAAAVGGGAAAAPHSPRRVAPPSPRRFGSRTAEPSGESGSGTSRWTCARTATCPSSAG